MAHLFLTLFGSAASIQENPTFHPFFFSKNSKNMPEIDPEIDYNRINYVPPPPRFEPYPPNFEPPVVYPSNLESPAYPPQAYSKPLSYTKNQYKPKQNCSVQDEIIRAEICTPTFKTLARTI